MIEPSFLTQLNETSLISARSDDKSPYALPKTKQPFWVFDTRLVIDPIEFKDLGINLWQLGYGNNK